MKVSNTFNTALEQAAALLAKNPTEEVVLEKPFSGMFVQMTESRTFPSEKKRFKDYAVDSNEEFFYLVIRSLMG